MPTSEYRPTVADVATHLNNRTQERGTGTLLGTFTSETSPTEVKVETIITTALREVSAVLGADIPDSLDPDDPDALREMAKSIVSLDAAMIIESSFYSQQIETGRSNYGAMERRFKYLMTSAASAIEEAGGRTTPGSEGGDMRPTGYMKPSFDFGDHRMTTMDEDF